MTAQREELAQESVAERAVRRLMELGFTCRVTDSGATVLLGPYSADELADALEEQKQRIRKLEEDLAAPPY